jgi:MoaA/NifB/PqqE/SkfB family radical SAM enzyme
MGQRFLIGIEPTQHCNLRCAHCLRADHRSRAELDVELFARILEQAHVYGQPHIALTGGEPTLHRRFFDLLALVRQHGYTCNVVTNGQNFPALVSRLQAFVDVLPCIAFSLDGATEATNDAIRGPGTFRRLVFAIGLARHRGFQVTVQMTLNRINRHDLGSMPALCRDLGVTALYISHTQPTPELYSRGLALGPDEWRTVERETRALAKEGRGVAPQLSLGIYNPGIAVPCLALQHRSLNIDYRGRLSVCCQLSGVAAIAGRDVIADLHTTPLAEAHRRLIAVVEEIVRRRLDGILDGTLSDADGFHCWWCRKHFGTLDWMRRYPDDAWVRADPALWVSARKGSAS